MHDTVSTCQCCQKIIQTKASIKIPHLTYPLLKTNLLLLKFLTVQLHINTLTLYSIIKIQESNDLVKNIKHVYEFPLRYFQVEVRNNDNSHFSITNGGFKLLKE